MTVSKNKIFYVARVILWLLILREPVTWGGKIGQCMFTCTYCNISTNEQLTQEAAGRITCTDTSEHESVEKIMEQEQKRSFVHQRPRSQIRRQATVMMPSVQQVAGWLLSLGCGTRLQCHVGSAFWPCDLWSHTRYCDCGTHFQNYSPQWPQTDAKIILLR